MKNHRMDINNEQGKVRLETAVDYFEVLSRNFPKKNKKNHKKKTSASVANLVVEKQPEDLTNTKHWCQLPQCDFLHCLSSVLKYFV